MIICFKRSKMILATIVVLLIIPAIMAVSKHICPEDTAKAVSTVFENQATSDKALVYLFMDRIQEQSDEFYAPYYTISSTIAYYFASVKEVREDGANLYITFSTLPYIGPHDTMGEDEISNASLRCGSCRFHQPSCAHTCRRTALLSADSPLLLLPLREHGGSSPCVPAHG